MLDVEGEVFDLYSKYQYFGESGVMDPFNWARNDRACFNYGTCPYFMLCKNCTNYQMYLQFFRMREIRYENEKKELNADFAFSTEQKTSMGFTTQGMKRLKSNVRKGK